MESEQGAGKYFSITDHCFEHQKYDPSVHDIQRLFADRCSYRDCGRPEIEHAWTVEAYRDNQSSIEEQNC